MQHLFSAIQLATMATSVRSRSCILSPESQGLRAMLTSARLRGELLRLGQRRRWFSVSERGSAFFDHSLPSNTGTEEMKFITFPNKQCGPIRDLIESMHYEVQHREGPVSSIWLKIEQSISMRIIRPFQGLLRSTGIESLVSREGFTCMGREKRRVLDNWRAVLTCSGRIYRLPCEAGISKGR